MKKKKSIRKLKTVYLIHEVMTDSECFENIKRMYKKNPELIMEPKIWKKRRLNRLKKEGKKWI